MTFTSAFDILEVTSDLDKSCFLGMVGAKARPEWLKRKLEKKLVDTANIENSYKKYEKEQGH